MRNGTRRHRSLRGNPLQRSISDWRIRNCTTIKKLLPGQPNRRKNRIRRSSLTWKFQFLMTRRRGIGCFSPEFVTALFVPICI
jgi:hypothetical protein